MAKALVGFWSHQVTKPEPGWSKVKEQLKKEAWQRHEAERERIAKPYEEEESRLTKEHSQTVFRRESEDLKKRSLSSGFRACQAPG